MKMIVDKEQTLLNEAVHVLLDRFPPSKVARILSAWQVGSGDYTAQKEKLFAGETVESLFAKAKAIEGQQRQ